MCDQIIENRKNRKNVDDNQLDQFLKLSGRMQRNNM